MLACIFLVEASALALLLEVQRSYLQGTMPMVSECCLKLGRQGRGSVAAVARPSFSLTGATDQSPSLKMLAEHPAGRPFPTSDWRACAPRSCHHRQGENAELPLT